MMISICLRSLVISIMQDKQPGLSLFNKEDKLESAPKQVKESRE
jgi:hypothetical protein